MDIFEILVQSQPSSETYTKMKKSIVSYFNKCSVLLSKFGFEAVLQTLVKNYKRSKQRQKSILKNKSRGQFGVEGRKPAAKHVLE